MPNASRPYNMSLEEIVALEIECSVDIYDGCLISGIEQLRNGSPWIHYQGRSRNLIHLIAQVHLGDIPEHHMVRHTCGFKECVNPDHIRYVPNLNAPHGLSVMGKFRWVMSRALSNGAFHTVESSLEKPCIQVDYSKAVGINPINVDYPRPAISWNKRTILLSRLVYMNYHKVKIPLHPGGRKDSKYLLHECDNHACIEPSHLKVGTPQENTNDSIKRNRRTTGMVPGSKHYKALVTEENVEEILRLVFKEGVSQVEASKRFGLSVNSAWFMCHGKTWKHVTIPWLDKNVPDWRNT